MGFKVDVYTSNPVLAERDARLWSPFYDMFGFTCDHNGDKGSGYVRGRKACYTRDIVYGDTAQFQFDALRQEYSNLETRGSRIYLESYALVDEVDAMFVDDSSKLARLSSSLPGMDLLHIIYHLIWHRLHDIQQRLFAVGGGVYYLEGVRNKDYGGVLSYMYKNAEGNEVTIPNLASWIIQHQTEVELLESAYIYQVHDIEQFAVEHMKSYTKALIGEHEFSENGKNVEKLPLPKAIRNFAKTQVNNWVDSAMTAVAFTENVHYIIDSEQIKPVEYHSTGTIQAFTNWSNGLHQMLQVKHGLKLSTETVTTNFLSNMAMFQKYGSNLVGFTGTLGSDFGQKILQDVYSVETVVIPELYYKRYKQLPPQVVQSRADLISRVVHSAVHESQKRRAVLVICETIKEAELIAGEIEKAQGNFLSGFKASVSLYTRNDQNQEKRVEQVSEGDIIVATNLAGRGTDINATKVEPFGGLHVILTFLPSSLRVELQAYGRTARQGNKGSGELIVMSKDGIQDYQELIQSRDKVEEERLSSFKEKELVKIQAKDKLFSRFCELYSRIRMVLNGYALHTLGYNALTPLEHTRLHAIEQEWAILLKKVDEGEIHHTEAEQIYSDFERRINDTYANVDESISATENCFYWTQFGNEYYRRGNSFKDHTSLAYESFEKAIKIDEDVAAEAHCGLGYCLLRGKSHWYKQNSHLTDYKTEAVVHLKKAQDILNEEMGMYAAAQTLLLQRLGRSDSELFKQLTEKMNLIGEYSSYIQNAITATEKSRRKVYVKETWASDTEFSRRWVLNEEEPRITAISISKDTMYDLEFHDLTRSYDMGTKDQALETIENIEIKRGNIGIRVSNQDLGALMECIGHLVSVVHKLELRGTDCIPMIKQVLTNMSPLSYMIKIHNSTPKFAKDLLRAASKIGYDKVIWEFEEDFGSPEGVCREEASRNASVPKLELFAVEVYMTIDSDLVALGNLLPPEADVSLVLSNVSHDFIKQNWTITRNATEMEEDYDFAEDLVGILQTFTGNTSTFMNLTKAVATQMINVLRQRDIPFLLLLQNMQFKEANKALKKSGRKVEDMKEKSLKEMGYQFSSTYIPLEAIQDLRQRGLVLMPEFSEVPFIPWRTIGTMGIIASVQMTVGGVLLCTGVGSSVGMGLLTEGMADIFMGYQIAATREFSWKDYAIQKAVSLSISALSMGLSSLKQGAKQGGAAVVQGVASEVAEQVGTRAATGEPVKEGLKAVGSNVKTAFTLASVQQCETVARVGINTIVATVLDFTFEHVRSYIEKEVENGVTLEFRQQRFFDSLATAVLFDRSNILRDKMSGWIYEITNQQSHGWLKMWESLGSTLCQAFSKFEHLQSTFSVICLVAGVVTECKQLAEIVEKVCKHIQSKLESECETLTPAYAIQERFGVTSNAAHDIANRMVFGDYASFQVSKYPDQGFLLADQYKNVSLYGLKLLFQDMRQKRAEFSRDGETMSRLISSVVDQLTDHIIGVANRQLAQPMMTLALGSLVSKISHEIQNKYVLREGQESNEQRRVRDLKGKNPEELTAEEKSVLQKHDSLETNEVVHTPRDIPPVPQNLTKQQKEEMAAILAGSSGGIGVGLILSELHDANVKFVSDPNYVMTEDDINSGRRIVIWKNTKSKKNGAGLKFTLKASGTDGTPINSEFDSVYKMFSSITGKSPNALRDQAAAYVAFNGKQFHKIDESVKWVENKVPETTANFLPLKVHDDIKINTDVPKKPKAKDGDGASATTTTSTSLQTNSNGNSSSSSTSTFSKAIKTFNQVKDFVKSEKETITAVMSTVSDQFRRHRRNNNAQESAANPTDSGNGTGATRASPRERESRGCADMPESTHTTPQTQVRTQKLPEQNAPPPNQNLNLLIILHVILIILVSFLLYSNYK